MGHGSCNACGRQVRTSQIGDEDSDEVMQQLRRIESTVGNSIDERALKALLDNA
jgi:hypothetical protein